MFVIGHGIDLVQHDRIARMLEEHGDRFTTRCFTARERAYAEAGRRKRIERYAVRFACKEAVLKAIGTGWRDGISWCDIEVIRRATGQPDIRLSGRCADLAADLGIDRWSVSLSHTDTHSMASAIAGTASAG